ncbi:MAG: aldo/keto reductase, partial [Caldilineaceae bacterium SB0666_bin_21]|nr:aldo/keto reductase [Caldilineaceae bacterium SB0666_bin_21]
KEGLSTALLSLAGVRQQAGVAAILVGARNPSELTRNLPVLEVSLSQQTQARLARITEPVRSHLGSNPDMWFSESRFR